MEEQSLIGFVPSGKAQNLIPEFYHTQNQLPDDLNQQYNLMSSPLTKPIIVRGEVETSKASPTLCLWSLHTQYFKHIDGGQTDLISPALWAYESTH